MRAPIGWMSVDVRLGLILLVRSTLNASNVYVIGLE
jgi:hypothetical protein